MQLRNQAALLHLSRRALASGDARRVLGEVCRIAARILQVDHVHVLELLPDGRTLIMRAAAGWPPERLARWQLALDPDSRLAEALRTGGMLVLAPEAASPPPGACDLLQATGMRHGLIAALATDTDGPALLGAYSAAARRYSREDLQFLRAAAHLVEAALQREAEAGAEVTGRIRGEAAQADLLRIVVGRLRPALRESVGHLWRFRTQPADSFSFRRAVLQAERKVASVADFIEDLSLLADLLEQPNLARGSVPVAPILCSVVEQLQERAQANDVSLHLRVHDEFLGLVGDAGLFRRALFNVLDNALRFTGPGGGVTVTLAAPDAAAGEIEVVDTGRGMTAAQLARLARDEDGAVGSAHRGPGLGWRLAAAIVRAHGGTLSARSAGPDLGSSVTLRFPRIAAGNLDGAQRAE